MLVGSFAIYAFTVLVLTVIAAIAFQARAGAPTLPYLVCGLAVAAAASLAGGYSAAALAAVRPGLHAAGVAAMILVAQLSTLLSPPAGIPRWDPAALAVIGPVFALAGGYRRLQRHASTQT